jgi:hypothetical protein
MGFMDKVKAQATVLADKAQTGVQQGQVKLQEMQSGKQVDHVLRELGARVFLQERGRAEPDSQAKVAGLMDQLDALEAAGTPVTATPEPLAAAAADAVPRPGTAPPAAPGAPPPPVASSVVDPIPPAGSAVPPSGGAIPKSGGGLPGQ